MLKSYYLFLLLFVSGCTNYKHVTNQDLENIDPNDFKKIQAYILFDNDFDFVIYQSNQSNKTIIKNIETGKALFSLNKKNNKYEYVLENETPGIIVEITPELAKVDFNEVILNFRYNDFYQAYILDRSPVNINGLSFERIDHLNPMLVLDLRYFESEENKENKDIIKGKTVK